ncbi:MAG: hypothetical protein UV58_C0013G0005 [Candidatus Wolfebacteria bacterium GW2011_GWC1_43_10]|uniref:Uncharacterized protein n=1 Tax=Candidatus Wolfebacteria bacterium GW2011_GWC1_43_10 TaxID=1619011 RepID=A0A0G1C911_9BACT|nr:MAG: hypothetical protein UV58_C0013G0005 [Candidatus Wolfebacteria bacterium GW2011_GWC1_43_10]HZX13018.1 hypothetical protein [Thermodesulfobacteriota bacterium]
MKFDSRINDITQKFFMEAVVDSITKSNPIVEKLLKDSEGVKITWQDRILWFVNDWMRRFSLAFEALSGRHRCEDEY